MSASRAKTEIFTFHRPDLANGQGKAVVVPNLLADELDVDDALLEVVEAETHE